MRSRADRRTVPGVEIGLLGPLEIRDDDGEQVRLSGTRLQKLLTLLALRCGDVVADDQLVDALWGDNATARSANALQRQVSTLRQVLGGPDLVQRRGGGYVLTIDRSAIDIVRFDSGAARGHDALRQGDPRAAREQLDAALQLWRGEALSHVAYAEFAQLEITRLNEARLAATESRIDANLALGQASALVGELERLVTVHPLREHLWAQLMLALARSGRQADALRAYQSARSTLADELGLEPSQELRDLETAILRQDPAVVRRETAPQQPDRRSNLRIPLTSMVGRKRDLAALHALVAEHRIVTLVGTGGVGKSRLATEAAREWLDSGDLDVWFVELSDVTDPEEVVPAIMTALDVPRATSTRADMQRLIEFLDASDTVIVLDNCEHLIESVARVAQDLLESCATLKIWSTSREGLAIPGEVLWPVAPLPRDDAITLFVERAGAANPSARLDANATEARVTLDDICSRLDGLPLAIELAAARLRSMPITELATGLENRFRFLSRGLRTARPRQQTLRAVVDWSYNLLFDDERRVFERLSVFGGVCTLAAARVVCADEDITGDDVADVVARLAEKSLLRIETDEVEGYLRCRMLQTLVEYARESLEASGDAARVEGAHVRYYADFARRSIAALQGQPQRGWLRAVSWNMGNLRSAFEIALRDGDAETACVIAGSLGWYWWFTGRALEGSHWLARARSCRGDVDEVTEARVAAWTAFTRAPGFVQWSDQHRADEEGHRATKQFVEEVDELCSRAVKLYRSGGALAELAGAETALAITFSTRGDFARARELLADAVAIQRSLEQTPHVAAMTAFVSGRLAFAEDRYTEAEETFDTSVTLCTASGAHAYCAFALRYIARLAQLRGDYPKSIAAIEHALDFSRNLGLAGFVTVLTSDLGEAIAATDDFDRARAILAGPLKSARDAGFLPGVAESLTALGQLEWRAGDKDAAATLAREALDIALEANSTDAAARCDAILGLVAADAGGVDEARARHLGALQRAARADTPRLTALALEGLANVALLETDACEAARLLGAASALRASPGGAHGPAFATTVLIDQRDLLATATEIARSEAVSRWFAQGEADPSAVTESLLLVAGRGPTSAQA